MTHTKYRVFFSGIYFSQKEKERKFVKKCPHRRKKKRTLERELPATNASKHGAYDSVFFI